MYSNRRMQIARQSVETCINRAGNGIYIAATQRHNSMFPTKTTTGAPSSISNALNKISSKASQQKNKGTKKSKHDKQNKSNRKVQMTSEATSLLDIQINSLKSVLSRQYPNTTHRLSMSSAANPQFHIPNILSNALKRSAESKPKHQNKKQKKKNSSISPIMTSMLSNHSKNGLMPNKSNVPYVRVAIANGKVEPESKTLGLCETPKYGNSNKMLNESDLRKIGLRFEIFD